MLVLSSRKTLAPEYPALSIFHVCAHFCAVKRCSQQLVQFCWRKINVGEATTATLSFYAKKNIKDAQSYFYFGSLFLHRKERHLPTAVFSFLLNSMSGIIYQRRHLGIRLWGFLRVPVCRMSLSCQHVSGGSEQHRGSGAVR